MPDRSAQLIRPGPSAAFNESQHPGLQAQRLHEDNFVALVAREPFLGLLDLDKPAEGWPAGRGPGSRVEVEVGHTGPAAVRVSGVPFDQLTKPVGAEIRREGFEDRRAGQAQVLLFHRVMVTFDVALEVLLRHGFDLLQGIPKREGHRAPEGRAEARTGKGVPLHLALSPAPEDHGFRRCALLARTLRR